MVDLCNISGIGRAICKALYEGGAEVYALSRTQSTLDSLKEEVTLTYSQIYKPIIAYLHVWMRSTFGQKAILSNNVF